jgi:PAS domain S-box-containing protein
MRVEPVFHFGGTEVPVGSMVGTWLLDAADVAITATDLEGRLFYANPAAERLVDWPLERLLGAKNRDFIPKPADRPMSDEVTATVATGQGWQGTMRIRRGDGQVAELRFSKQPLWWGGVVVGSVTASWAAEETPDSTPTQAARVEGLERQAAADRDEIANLRIALTTNRTIGAAVGIIMALHRLSQDEAFQVLNRASQDQNIRLQDLADDVVATGGLDDFGQ